MNNKLISGPWLGCIADDYTGATDLASFLVASGLRTIQLNGFPEQHKNIDLSHYDAIVVALKSRTCAIDVAIDDSLKSVDYLLKQGCQKFFFKYCSTFDSTNKGNIGPVIDALMDKLDVSSTVVCPALPVNGRTVHNGFLFVNGQLLHESPMKDHPLTPMKDSQIQRLLEAQAQGKAVLINADIVQQGQVAIEQALKQKAQEGRYIVLDALSTEHLVDISRSVGDFKLVTGGSGLATDLAYEFQQLGGSITHADTLQKTSQSPVVIFSGSCSAMTQKQVAVYQNKHPSLQLNPIDIANGTQTVDTIAQWMFENLQANPLIYASTDAENIKQVHETLGKEVAADLVETCFGELALKAKQHKVQNFIVAGGETSGAVVKALDINMFEIGPSIVPSVPIVKTLGDLPIQLALKSGNFGQQDFFVIAKEKFTCS